MTSAVVFDYDNNDGGRILSPNYMSLRWKKTGVFKTSLHLEGELNCFGVLLKKFNDWMLEFLYKELDFKFIIML